MFPIRSSRWQQHAKPGDQPPASCFWDADSGRRPKRCRSPFPTICRMRSRWSDGAFPNSCGSGKELPNSFYVPFFLLFFVPA